MTHYRKLLRISACLLLFICMLLAACGPAVNPDESSREWSFGEISKTESKTESGEEPESSDNTSGSIPLIFDDSFEEPNESSAEDSDEPEPEDPVASSEPADEPTESSDGNSEPKNREPADPPARKKQTIEPDDAPDIYDSITAPLVINEVMANNKNWPIDGIDNDWVEMFNNSSETINLQNYCLSDDSTKPTKCQLPNIKLKPGAYYVLRVGAELTFSISDKGDETLFLSDSKGKRQYSLHIPKCKSDEVVLADGTVSNMPTPGKPNMKSLSYTQSGDLTISEIVTNNTSLMQNANGKYYSLLELQNRSGSELVLSDYYISDSPSNLKKYRLPEGMIFPKEYYILQLTDDENASGNCIPITFGDTGKVLYITDETGIIVDSLYIPPLDKNKSYGRYEGKNVYFVKSSIGKENTVGYKKSSTPVKASLASGTYTGEQTVFLSVNDGGTIYYTTNGETPTTKSRVYQGEGISVTKVMAIRAINVNGGQPASDVASFTYMINIPDYTLDIIQVSVKKSDLDYIIDNYTSKREIEANVSYLKNGKEEFSIDCGFRLNGKSTRKMARKSFQLKFRTIYGESKLKYKMFDNLDIKEFNALVLRGGSAGAANFRYFINDEYATSIMVDSESEVLAQSYKPVNLYINDAYWGVYFVREKVSDDFVASHKNVSPESVTIVSGMKNVECGNNGSDWKTIWNYVLNNSLASDKAYEWIDSCIDLNEVMDYYIMESWAGNTDSGNVRVYYSTEGDGKWHMIFFDLDQTFDICKRKHGYGTVDSMLGVYSPGSGDGVADFNPLIYKLMYNATFRERIRERVQWWLNNELSSSAARARLDNMVNTIQHDMEYSIPVWKNAKVLTYHQSMSDWLKKIDELRNCWTGEDRAENFMKEWDEYIEKFAKKSK